MAVAVMFAVAACRGSGHGRAPVLTLVPAAMETGGAVKIGDGGTLCLRAGGYAEAVVHVHEPRLTMTVSARGPAAGRATLVVQLAGQQVGRETLRPFEHRSLTYRVTADGGQRRLRIELADGSKGEVCIEQVALRQP